MNPTTLLLLLKGFKNGNEVLQILLFDVVILLSMIYVGTQKTVEMMEFLIPL